MKKTVIAGLICLVSSSTFGSNWELIAEEAKGTSKFYLDTDSVKPANNRVTGMYDLLSIVVQPTYLKNSETRKKTGIYYSKQQWLISCDANLYYIVAAVDYDIKDNVIGSHQLRNNFISRSDFNFAFPDTIGEGVITAACNYHKTGDTLGLRPPLVSVDELMYGNL